MSMKIFKWLLVSTLLLPTTGFSESVQWGGLPNELNTVTNNNLNLVALHRLNTETLLMGDVCKVVAINNISYFMCDQNKLKKIICYSGEKPCQP